MDTYKSTLVGLLGLSSLLLVSQPTRQSALRAQAVKVKKSNPDGKIPPHSKKHPQKKIYLVYFLMTVSAWLQVNY
jgi:hypothetical protein